MADMNDLPLEASKTLRWLAEQPCCPPSSAAEHQPDPKPGREVVAEYVLADIQARVEAGEAKYGTKLMTHNGRDPLWDAYQEAIDQIFYIRQRLLEEDNEKRLLCRARALLVESPSPEKDDIAEAVALIESALNRRPVDRVEKSSSPIPACK